MMRQPAFVLRDTHTGQECRVEPDGVRIGRSAQNDIVLRDDNVSRHHATLWSQDDQLYIRDEDSTNGTWVNGERISTSRALREGDLVRLGGTVLRVALGSAPAVPLATASAPPGRRFPLVPVAIAGGVLVLLLIGVLFASLGGPPKTPTETPTEASTMSATVGAAATDTAGPTSTPIRPAATPTRLPATSTLRPTRTSVPPTSTMPLPTPTRVPLTPTRLPAATPKPAKPKPTTPTRIPPTRPPTLTPTRVPVTARPTFWYPTPTP
jgi:predicted component of type VI protein secretion system